jgi:hypothetical protein
MDFNYHSLFVEDYSHEKSLSYYCYMCDKIVFSHGINEGTVRNFSHSCVYNGITIVKSNFDKDDFVEFCYDEESDEQDSRLDHIASGYPRLDNDPQNQNN